MLRAIGCLFRLVFLILMLGLFIGPPLGSSLYLDQRGLLAPGEVVEKAEQIERTSGSLSWNRSLRITVTYQPQDSDISELATIRVDSATFDRLHQGSAVEVRYQPNMTLRHFPFFIGARLQGQSTLSSLSLMMSTQTLRFALLIIIGSFCLWLMSKVRARPIKFALLGLVLGDIAIIVLLLLTPVLYPDTSPVATATGHIRQVDRITVSPGGQHEPDEKLIKPIDRIEIEFVPAGMSDPVVALDEVDAGSIPFLAVGDQMTVSYHTDNPRGAQLTSGTRSHRWLNYLSLPLSLGIAIATGFLGLLVHLFIRYVLNAFKAVAGVDSMEEAIELAQKRAQQRN